MLQQMGTWDWVIYAVAGYIAVTTLVRLMLNRRNSIVGEIRSQLAKQQKKPGKAPSRPPGNPNIPQ